MAQDIVDAMVRQLGDERPCRTAETGLPGSEDGEPYQLGTRLRAREEELRTEQIICECELVGRTPARERDAPARHHRTSTTSGATCGSAWGRARAASASTARRASCTASGALDGAQASGSLRHFLQERWKGMWPILYGDQLRQARLDDWIFQGLLDVEHVPAETAGLPTPVDAELEPATLA